MNQPAIDFESTHLFDFPNQSGSPERRLLLAILERAILDYVGNELKEIEEAQEWIFGELSEPLLREYSFPWICEQLGLDTPSIAEKIRAMPKRGNRKVAPWYFANHN